MEHTVSENDCDTLTTQLLGKIAFFKRTCLPLKVKGFQKGAKHSCTSRGCKVTGVEVLTFGFLYKCGLFPDFEL